MSNLEDLVPPLELCRKIPAGKFDDSALVWWGACVYPRIYPDGVRYDQPWHKRGVIPAPTLVEIMRACDDLDEGDLPACTFTGVKWRMESVSGPFSASIKRHHTSDKNPATAALKLWLEVNKSVKSKIKSKIKSKEETEKTEVKHG